MILCILFSPSSDSGEKNSQTPHDLLTAWLSFFVWCGGSLRSYRNNAWFVQGKQGIPWELHVWNLFKTWSFSASLGLNKWELQLSGKICSIPGQFCSMFQQTLENTISLGLSVSLSVCMQVSKGEEQGGRYQPPLKYGIEGHFSNLLFYGERLVKIFVWLAIYLRHICTAFLGELHASSGFQFLKWTKIHCKGINRISA